MGGGSARKRLTRRRLLVICTFMVFHGQVELQQVYNVTAC